MRRSSGEVPLLAVPGARWWRRRVDGTALSFLVRRAVEDRKREKEEKARKKKEAQEKADLELAKRDPWWAQHLADMKAMEQGRYGNPSSAPKSFSGVRVRCCGQGFCSRSSFSGAQCSRLLTTGPRCSTSWPVLNRRTVMCSSCPRAVFPSLSSGPRCSASWPVWTRRIFSACARLGLLVFDDVPRAVLLLVVSGPRSRHHGRHGPQDSYVEVHRCSSWTRSFTCPLVCYEWRHGPDSAENCLAIPQVQFIITVVDIFFVTQRQFSFVQTIQLTIERFHCRSYLVVDVPVCRFIFPSWC